MSRAAGQVPARAGLLGAVVVALVVAGVVGLCDWLVPEGAAAPVSEAPAEAGPLPGAVVCPDLPPPDVVLDVDSASLFECPRLHDGRRVRYVGEAIAAVLPRGDRAWVQLNDDVYALGPGPLREHRTALGGNAGIAVSIPAEVGAAVRHVGGPAASGDLLAVEGRFLRADPADGGGPTIQADRAAIVRAGRPLGHAPQTRRVAVALVLGTATLALLAAVGRSRRAALARD